MAKTIDRDLFDRLHASGVRKRVAKLLSEATATGRTAGGRADATARKAIADLRSAADELEARLKGTSGTSNSRSAAAKKAAATRSRQAAKRSAAAKKAAATRAKNTGTTRAKTSGTTRASGTRTTRSRARAKSSS